MGLYQNISRSYFSCFEVEFTAAGLGSILRSDWEMKGAKLNKLGMSEVSASDLVSPKNSVCLLLVKGDFVLSKFSTSQEASLPPGMKEESFLVQRISTPSSSLVFAMSNQQVEALLAVFKKQDVTPVHCVLGYAGLASARTLTQFSGKDVIENESFIWDNGELIGMEEFQGDHNHELAQGAVMEYIAHSILSQPPVMISNKEEWRFKRLFEKVGLASLIFFLGVLLVNYFVFRQISGELFVAQSEAESHVLLKTEIEQLQVSISKDQQVAKSLIAESNSAITEVANVIASSVPPNVLLTSLQINPLNIKASGKKEVDYQQGVVVVEGEAIENKVLDQWLSELNANVVFENVQLVELSSEGKGIVFSVELNVQ